MNDGEHKEKLTHYIYSSAATVDFSHDDIISLLEVARKNNAKLGVTGMLLYDNGSFFQILEGQPQVVDSIYEKIEKDKRHNQVKKIICEEIEKRDFAEWTMGHAGLTRAELLKIEGFNDFFQGQKNLIDLDEGRAKTLLNAFKEGKWRSAIN